MICYAKCLELIYLDLQYCQSKISKLTKRFLHPVPYTNFISIFVYMVHLEWLDIRNDFTESKVQLIVNKNPKPFACAIKKCFPE